MKLLKFILPVLLITAACVFFFSFCQRTPETAEVATLAVNTPQDAPPQRIVSLAPSITETLFALGLEERIAAVSSDSDYPPQAANKTKVGTFWYPSAEAIIAAHPELVITLSFEQQKAVAANLERLGYKTLSLKLEYIEDVYSAINQIGLAANCPGRAAELAEKIRTELSELEKKFSTREKVKLIWVIQPEPLRVVGRNTFISELIVLAGGENAITDTSHSYPITGDEHILTCGADVIIHSAMGTADTAAQQRAAETFWTKYPNLPAVKNKRIYIVDSDSLLRLGPRLPEAVETIGQYLHGEK